MSGGTCQSLSRVFSGLQAGAESISCFFPGDVAEKQLHRFVEEIDTKHGSGVRILKNGCVSRRRMRQNRVIPTYSSAAARC